MSQANKICNTCNIDKSINDFAKNRVICKECVKIKDKANKDKRNEENKDLKIKCNKCNEEKDILEYLNNGKQCKKCRYEYQLKHKNESRNDSTVIKTCNMCNASKFVTLFMKSRNRCLQCDADSKKNDKQREMSNNYKKNNRDKINAYQNQRRNNDSNIRIRETYATYLSHLINTERNCIKLLKVLNCEKETFKKWIQFQFDSNMNWDNYGKYWQFDHVMPCIQYDLTDDLQLNRCYNYINIQPIETNLNKKKLTKSDGLLIVFKVFKWLLFKKREQLKDDSD